MKRREILRILDANFNRSREGLRVCEEIARFVLEDELLTRAIKRARHSVSRSLQNFPVSSQELLGARESDRDVGKKSSTSEKKRVGSMDLFLANMQRTKESLRVLEETSKLINEKTSMQIKKARFYVYSIEKKAISKLAALRHH